MFLIAFAECAANPSYDSAEAVRRCLAGESPRDGAPCVKGGAIAGRGAEAKGGFDDGGGSGAKGESEADSKALNEFKADAGDANDRGKSRGGTRGGKPQQQTTDVGLGGFSGAPSAMNLDAEVERCDGNIQLTQQMLGEVIRRPKLTEKLLGRPPFKFLYDIVMEVKNTSGFANGLFTEEESEVANVAAKEQKIAFLDKIIMLVGVQLNTIVGARPAKIVAGMDSELTNTFLQLLAVCAKSAPNSNASVPTVLDKLGLPGGEMLPPRGAGPGMSPQPSADSDAKQSSSEVRSPPPAAKAAEPERREIGAADAKSGDGDGDDAGGETKRTGRPTTARRRPPKVKDGAKEVDKGASPVKKASGIMVDGADDDEDEDIPLDIDSRLADDVRADGKGASAPAESKIVRDILGRQAEQEAARAAPEAADAGAEQKTDESSSKGGIRIGRLRRTGTDKRGGDKGAKESSGNGPAALGEGDLDKLRNSIQVLVQNTGPLGSVLDYLQEDVGLMTQELRKWEEESRKFEGRLAMEQDKTNEELQPLQAELTELDVQIAEKIAQISSTKANVARNEERILQLMKMMSSHN